MKYFDTHTHIFKEYFSREEQEEIFKRCKEENIEYIMMPACTKEECFEVLEYKSEHIKIAFGIHPSEAKSLDALDFAKDFDFSKYDAIGEIGLDTHWEDNPPMEIQEEIFIKQLDIAHKYSLPVIIHNRHQTKRVIEIINRDKYKDLTFIFHSFTDGPEEVKLILENTNAFIAFNGVVTFKNAHNVREALELVPIDRLIAETDAPYLSPEPLRGKTNNPCNVKHTIAKMAEVKNIDLKEFADIIYKNSFRAYNL